LTAKLYYINHTQSTNTHARTHAHTHAHMHARKTKNQIMKYMEKK